MVVEASATGPRVLLRQLRDIMASSRAGQRQLDQIVRVIAGNMVAEVCSIYLLRAGDILELFATEGLNTAAVHRTRLRVGEGLVGDVAAHARPLNLADAQAHPLFVYRPETGEEAYQSLLGVPIHKAGKVLGVLVVQNRTMRNYSAEEVEALETVAMVLAELAGSGDLVPPDELLHMTGNATLPQRLEGLALTEGLAKGRAVFHRSALQVDKVIADDSESERRRLAAGIDALRVSIDEMLDNPVLPKGGESREVLETYKLFAWDRGWHRRLMEAVESGVTAEAAVMRVQVDIRARMAEASAAYLRERIDDLEDLASQLLRHLSGAGDDPSELPEKAVVVARTMGAAELLSFDRTKLRAVVLEEGSTTAHVAIVARALDLPVIGAVKGALRLIEPGDRVIVDCEHEQVLIRPAGDVLAAFSRTQDERAEQRAKYDALRHEPAHSRDGVAVGVHMNAGLLVDLPQLDTCGAEGIGLYRTELAFMMRAQLPSVQDQVSIYQRVLEAAGDRPVLFRTLDIGGDKILPYMTGDHEANPAMGWRAVRIGLDRPALLRSQLRALLKAAQGRTLSVMFPMIAEVAEFDAVLKLLERERERLTRLGEPLPDEVRAGVMLEVPALAFQLPALLRKAEFVSVGSNDLMQFLFASDRENPRMAHRYDVLSPALLSFMRELVLRCDDAGVDLSICGEVAGRPLEAMAMIGVGLRAISIPPSAVGPIKMMVRDLNVEDLSGYLEPLIDSSEHSLRNRLQNFARDHGVSA
jgi:phosphotransferase system enzyme I (PtsP)